MESEQGPITLFEEALCSKGRARLLYILSRHKALNTSRLAREAGLSYEYTSKHLEALVRAGVVKEQGPGRLKMFSLNQESELARRIASILRTWPE